MVSWSVLCTLPVSIDFIFDVISRCMNVIVLSNWRAIKQLSPVELVCIVRVLIFSLTL